MRPSTPSLSSRDPLAFFRLLCAVAPALLVVATVALAGCRPASIISDKTAPRVVSVAPASPIVPVDTVLALTFSEPIDEGTLDADPVSDGASIALVPRARAETVFTDLKTAGLNETNENPRNLVPIDVVVDGVVVTVMPRIALDPLTDYSLVVSADVRDRAQNPVVDALGLASPFRYDFSTDAGPPSVVSADVNETALVAPNRRRISMTFNQPVIGISRETLSLSPAAPVESIELDESRTNATMLLGAPTGDGCARLSPQTEYTLSATSEIVADNGQALLPFSTTFLTGTACDTTELSLVDEVEAIAGEVAATIRFQTNKPSTTEVRFGVGEDIDCQGAPCPIVGNPARAAVPGTSPPRFQHSLELTGLSLGVTYRVVVNSEDDVGNTVRGEITVTTAPLPRVNINEVMANAIAPEGDGEFVELANFGDAAVDLGGWTLLVDGGDGGGGCTATWNDGVVLPAGGFVVLAKPSFDQRYGLADESLVVRLTKACTLVNGGEPLTLLDSDGRPVSSVSVFTTTSSSCGECDGFSIERTAPEAADVDTSYCRARADVGATPGRVNSVVVHGCE
jgi:hypothetical protein